MTHIDSVRLAVFNDSVNVKYYFDEFKSFVFKELKTPEQYEYLKSLIDMYFEQKKKIWQQVVKQK